MTLKKDYFTVLKELREPKQPIDDGDVLLCPNCKSWEFLFNEDSSTCSFCGNCGQRISWENFDI